MLTQIPSSVREKKKKILKVSCSWSPDQQQWISTSVSHNLKLPEAGPSLRHQQQNYRSSRTKSNQSNYDSASSARSTANSMVESVPLFRFGKSIDPVRSALPLTLAWARGKLQRRNKHNQTSAWNIWMFQYFNVWKFQGFWIWIMAGSPKLELSVVHMCKARTLMFNGY